MGGFFGLILVSNVNSVYSRVAKPALEAIGNTGTGTLDEELRIALNPCIVDGPLPEGCEKYVVNGEVLQPPIKIIIDTTRTAEVSE